MAFHITDLDPAPFTAWITACGLEDAAFTTMARELNRELLARAITRADAEIGRVEGVLAQMSKKQTARRNELLRETDALRAALAGLVAVGDGSQPDTGHAWAAASKALGKEVLS